MASPSPQDAAYALLTQLHLLWRVRLGPQEMGPVLNLVVDLSTKKEPEVSQKCCLWGSIEGSPPPRLSLTIIKASCFLEAVQGAATIPGIGCLASLQLPSLAFVGLDVISRTTLDYVYCANWESENWKTLDSICRSAHTLVYMWLKR